MGALRLILGLMAAVVIVSFGVLNMKPVSITYHRIGTIELPLFYILLGFFVAGFFVAWIGGVFDRLRFYARFRSYRRQIRTLEKELKREKEKDGRFLPESLDSGSNGETARALPAPGVSNTPTSPGFSPASSPASEEARNAPHN